MGFLLIFEHMISAGVGMVVRIPIPKWLRGVVYWPFVWATGIRISEADRPLIQYSSVDALFTRSIHADLRPMGSESWVSPCDGRILTLGNATDDQVLCVKNQRVSIAQFQAHHPVSRYLVIYLSPKDCHQIIMPTSGLLKSIQFFPGRLSTVRPHYIARHPEVLLKNARLNFNLELSVGRATMIMVGAMNVSSISTPFTPRRRLSCFKAQPEMRIHQEINKGELAGVFHLGSTVVLLFESDVDLNAAFQPGDVIRMGQGLIKSC